MAAVQAVGEDAEAEWSSSQAHLAEDQEVSEVAASAAEAVVASPVAVDLAEAAEAAVAGKLKSGGWRLAATGIRRICETAICMSRAICRS